MAVTKSRTQNAWSRRLRQAHVHADGIPARGGLEGLGEIAKHEQARRIDRGARLGDPQLHGGELGHAAVAAGHRTAGGAYARHRQEIGEGAFRHAEHRRHDGDRQHGEE